MFSLPYACQDHSKPYFLSLGLISSGLFSWLTKLWLVPWYPRWALAPQSAWVGLTMSLLFRCRCCSAWPRRSPTGRSARKSWPPSAKPWSEGSMTSSGPTGSEKPWNFWRESEVTQRRLLQICWALVSGQPDNASVICPLRLEMLFACLSLPPFLVLFRVYSIIYYIDRPYLYRVYINMLNNYHPKVTCWEILFLQFFQQDTPLASPTSQFIRWAKFSPPRAWLRVPPTSRPSIGTLWSWCRRRSPGRWLMPSTCSRATEWFCDRFVFFNLNCPSFFSFGLYKNCLFSCIVNLVGQTLGLFIDYIMQPKFHKSIVSSTRHLNAVEQNFES